jgi:hypothetical protein
MFPSQVEINPVDEHSMYPWDSDLFGPADEDGNSFFVLPGAPVGGAPVGGGAPIVAGAAPLVPDPNIAAILAEAQAVHAALDAMAAAGAGGGAPALETLLQRAYDRLSALLELE